MSVGGLDFLGIGAAKAGTTSLHEYLRTHPELFLPESKEQAFFTDDATYENGWSSFASVAFRRAPRDRLYGKVSPQYLGGPVRWHDSTARDAGDSPELVTPGRIARQFPHLKLIVLLRDPVERALSEYRLAVLWRAERRPLAVALADELSPKALASARARPTGGHGYIVAGEYGRLLRGYLECFERSQLFVGSAHTLERDPATLLADLWRFLAVDDSHVPPNLGVRYNARRPGRRLRALDPGALPVVVKRTWGLRHAWRAMPRSIQDRIQARYRATAYRPNGGARTGGEAPAARPDPELIARMRSHFDDDLALLADMVGPVPGVTAGDPVPDAT